MFIQKPQGAGKTHNILFTAPFPIISLFLYATYDNSFL